MNYDRYIEEVSKNDNKFEIVRLTDICELITDGTHLKPEYKEQGIKFLSAKNVVKGVIDWKNVKYIDEKQHLELSKRARPQKNDLLLAKNGTTGVCALNETDEIFDIYVSLALLRPSEKILPNYLLYLLNSHLVKEQFNSRLQGVGVPNLHLKEIKEVQIPLPPLSIQQKIVDEISQEELKIKNYELKIKESRENIADIIKSVWIGEDADETIQEEVGAENYVEQFNS